MDQTSKRTYSPRNISPTERIAWWGHDAVQRRHNMTPCHEWRGPKHKAGYGNVRSKTSDGRQTFVRAHRVSLQDSGVDVPGHLHVLHLCDNPPCINPEHLMVGDDAENSRQMKARGRARNKPQYGTENPSSKLTPRKVRNLRAKYATGQFLQRDLAKQYNISQTAVSKIILGKTWR